ncbi:alpha/beta-hydrolase [Penicillium atrosanguineum]|nr:alpha/beta-hydrolase [Penicillium atrosanguineum]
MEPTAKIGVLEYLRLKVLATLLRIVIAPVLYLQNWQDLPEPKDERRQRIQVPSRDPDRHIDAFLYSPLESSERSFDKLSKVPLLINWHSSGFVVPSLGTDRAFFAFIARATNLFILDVDYRKAPEHPFPAAYHDMEDVISWVTLNHEHFDISRLIVSGFSAGGNLALEAAALVGMANIGEETNRGNATADGLLAKAYIRAVVAVYPTTDLSLAPEARIAPCPIDPISPAMQSFFWDCYAPDPASRSDPRVSPAHIDPRFFSSNVAIVTCDGDNFHPEAAAFAKKLDDGVRRVVLCTLEGVGHGFDKGARQGSYELQARQKMHDAIAAFLRTTPPNVKAEKTCPNHDANITL